MDETKKSLKISAPITPYSAEDTFPTHLAIFGKGGLRTVDTIEERNAIPADRRELGMMVYVVEKNNIYVLRDDISNNQWTDFQTFMEGFNGPIKVSAIEPEDPTPVTIWFDIKDGNIFYRNPDNTSWVQSVPPLVDGGEF